jgi:hypothetical protein
MPMPRPTKYTEEKAAAICKDIERGNTLRVSTTVNGVPESTFNDWRNRYPEFSEAVKVAEARAEQLHVGNIVREATAGEWTASAWWLERRRHDDWRKVERQEITGADGGPLVVERVEFRGP